MVLSFDELRGHRAAPLGLDVQPGKRNEADLD
jgi:hypothetical protein